MWSILTDINVSEECAKCTDLIPGSVLESSSAETISGVTGEIFSHLTPYESLDGMSRTVGKCLRVAAEGTNPLMILPPSTQKVWPVSHTAQGQGELTEGVSELTVQSLITHPTWFSLCRCS